MKKAQLAMAFHCYQPVDNFGWTIEAAYEKAYKPFVQTLEEFPKMKVSFHFSGNMLEWLSKKHPGYIDKLGRLLEKGRIELIGGGFYEPILALIPERDREGQIRKNEDLIRRIFGVKPRGVWTTERVWTPEVARTLSAVEAEYTILDDYHLLSAGVADDKMFGPYVTCNEAGSITLFPSMTKLRYMIPCRSPEVTIRYIKEKMQESSDEVSCFFFADDGEKFGHWPHTFWWVHKKGWLRSFFGALQENSDWLNTALYSEIKDDVPSKGMVKVPESSYAEMMEWSGGSFGNFLKKYPGIKRMHSRMLGVSDSVERVRNTAEDKQAVTDLIEEAEEELYKAQSGCAYWHGTFGGYYFPHLRSGIYGHLIKAQDIIDTIERDGFKRVSSIEHGKKGHGGETVIKNRMVNVFVKSAGGMVTELDFKPFNVNVMNTIPRIEEKYHRKLKRGYALRIRRARKAVMQGELVDIHDVLGISERGLRKFLVYDDHERASFMTHIFEEKRSWRKMDRGVVSNAKFFKGIYSPSQEERPDGIAQVLSKREKIFLDNNRPFDVEVVKKVDVSSGASVRFGHSIVKRSGGVLPLRYAIEFNFSIKDKDLQAKPRLMKGDKFTLKDEHSALEVKMFLDRDMTVFAYPVYTVNESESGLEKIFQGVSVLFGEECELVRDGEERSVDITLEIA